MAESEITPPFEFFTDIDGQPLEAGYIYIGQAGLDPETNPIQAYWDRDLTVVANQPLRTISGRIDNSGTPSKVFIGESDYSIAVRNRNGTLVDTDLNNTFTTSGTLQYFATIADAISEGIGNIGSVVRIGERENALFDIVDATTVIENGYNIIAIDAEKSLQLRVESIMALRAFGTVGDGVADDNGAIQAAFDSIARVLLGRTGDIYLSESQLDMSENQTLDLCGADLRFNESGFVRYLVTNNGCTVVNGAVRSVTTDVTVRGGDYQQPIVIGQQNSLTGVNDVTVRNVTFSSTSPEGNACFVFSASNNILVEDIIIESGSSFGEPIGAHWGVEPGGDETQGTSHPNNITFRNVYIEQQSYGGAGPIFLSAVRNVVLENIVIEDYTGDGCIQIFAGDHGFTYALKSEDQEFGSVVKINNVTGRGTKGVLVFMRDTLDAQIKWPSRIEIVNCHFVNTFPATGTTRGIELGSVDGVYISNTTFENYFYNVFFNGTATDITFNQCRFLNSTDNCIDANNSAGCRDLKFVDCYFEGSNQNGGVGYDGIFASYIDGITFDGCFFDSPDTTFTLFFDSVEPARNVKIINNHVENAGGANFVFGSSSSFGICELFAGNTQGETNNNNIRGGQDLVAYSLTGSQNSKLPIREFMGLTSSNPSFGTYHRNDRIYSDAVTSASKIGRVCTAGGSQGTYSEGLTATTDGTTTVTLSAASNVLRKNDYVTINATNVQIVSISGTTMEVSATIPAAAGVAIAYTAGTFVTWGATD